MLPDAPWLVKCQHCGALVWIDEQEQVGEIELWAPRDQDTSEFEDARPPATPSLQDYFAVLSTPVSHREKERYLRLRAWWAGNDPRRQSDRALPMSDDEIANLRALLPFLDEADENDRLMKAEALRELSMFPEAQALLSKSFSNELARAVAIIRDLTDQRISKVREMEFE